MIKNSAKIQSDIIKYGTKAEKACISALDKTATVLRNSAIENMQTQACLKKSTLLKKVNRLGRARVGKMSTGIYTAHRAVLLHNFPHSAVKGKGVRVKVSPRGGYGLIRDAFIGQVPLKGSGVRGYIAMRNNDLIRMLMSTPTQNASARSTRINKLRAKKSWGISPLYATSENQMLHDIKKRGDLNGMALTTMSANFLARFRL